MRKTTLLLAHFLKHHAGLWAGLGLLPALAFGPPPAQAAVTEAWVHRYSNVVSNSDDQAFKVLRDAAGDIIVTGTTYDGIAGRNTQSIKDTLTIKYSGADGSVLWQQRYTNAYPQAVAVDGSGNVVVTWYSTTVKYAAADGALLWEQLYDGGSVDSRDFAQAAAVDGDGNVVVTGTSYSTNGYSDYYTVKYAATDGALLWEQRYNGPANSYDYAEAAAVDGSGNVVVTGYSYGTNYDYCTVKYAAADGALLWEQRYTNAGYYGFGPLLAMDGSGNVVVTGTSQGDYYTAKYAASNGALLWDQRYNAPVSYNEAKAVVVDGSGNVVVTGYSIGNGSSYDYYTAKYAAASGALLWEKRYNGPANSGDVANAVDVDGSGNVVVTGYSAGTNGGSDYYTAKYAAANGALLWEKRYTNVSASAVSVAVDGSGNVVVTGYSYGVPNSGDYYTAKYAAADGALLWEQRYAGLSKSYNEPKAVVVDGSGNVVVTGYSEGNGSSGDYDNAYYTAKYAAANGALMWEQRSNGYSQAMAVDGSGNVVVAGYSATVKYAAANGALLWEKRSTNGSASVVVVDGSGNVVVTGSSIATNGYYYKRL